MLVIALVAVCLGILVEVPGLGVILLLVATPSLIRTLGTVARRKAAGRPLTHWEKAQAFAGSVAVVTAIGVGSVAAFTVTCFPIGAMAFGKNDTWGLYAALAVGLVAGGAVGFVLIRKLWPRRFL
jgi:hypothetical protein